jgi:hypothetical protein
MASKPWINRRWNEGRTSAAALHAEMAATQGWTASVQAVERYVRQFRTADGRTRTGRAPRPAPAAPPAPKTRQITRWLLRLPAAPQARDPSPWVTPPQNSRKSRLRPQGRACQFRVPVAAARPDRPHPRMTEPVTPRACSGVTHQKRKADCHPRNDAFCALPPPNAREPRSCRSAGRRAFSPTFCVTQRDFVPAVAAGSGTMPTW